MLVWRDDGQRLLLLERSGTGLMDGRFSLPGGHIQPGETLVQAAIREVREETDLEIKEIEPACVLPYSGGINFIFTSRFWEGVVRNCEPEKCSQLGWFERNQPPEKTVPWLEKALELYENGNWFHEVS